VGVSHQYSARDLRSSIVWLRVPESRSDHAAGSIDCVGAVLATVALGGIVYAFIEAPTQGWRSTVAVALIAGVLAAAAFIVTEQRVRSPMLRPGASGFATSPALTS
jgi:peptidoglycan/LPS O-acetylase OafA/YrhL